MFALPPVRFTPTLPNTDASIFLLQPSDLSRTQVIAALSDQPGTLYYALTAADSSGAAITTGILTQTDRAADSAIFDSPLAAGRALAVTLIDSEVRQLILDCADYLSDSHITEWLTGLSEWLKTGHLIVAGRTLRLNDWQAALDDRRAMLWSPDKPDDRQPRSDRLIVSGFGRGQVWYGGQIADDWDGPLARRLFYFLIDQSPVSRDQVFQIYWAELSIREATNVFHVTKRKVNETVGCEVMLFQNRRYVINPAIGLAYDVRAFETAIREAEAFNLAGNGAAAQASWATAVQLYRQPFLNSEAMPWIVRRRDQLREQYAEALAQLAQRAQAARDDDRALTGWLRAINELPLREDWTINAMTLYAARGDLAAARDRYEWLRTQLNIQLSLRPGLAVTAAYRTLIGASP